MRDNVLVHSRMCRLLNVLKADNDRCGRQNCMCRPLLPFEGRGTCLRLHTA